MLFGFRRRWATGPEIKVGAGSAICLGQSWGIRPLALITHFYKIIAFSYSFITSVENCFLGFSGA